MHSTRTLYMSCAYMLPARVEPVCEGRCAGHCMSLMRSTFSLLTADVVAVQKVGGEAASCSPAGNRSAQPDCVPQLAHWIDTDFLSSAIQPTKWV